jgi:hypothetical protein
MDLDKVSYCPIIILNICEFHHDLVDLSSAMSSTPRNCVKMEERAESSAAVLTDLKIEHQGCG